MKNRTLSHFCLSHFLKDVHNTSVQFEVKEYGKNIFLLDYVKSITARPPRLLFIWHYSVIIVLAFDHRVCFFLMNILGKRSDLPFSRKSDRKKEKNTVSFTHVQNTICSQTQLDGIAHEQTIISRQLFAGHVVGFRPMKRKKNLLRMSNSNCYPCFNRFF